MKLLVRTVLSAAALLLIATPALAITSIDEDLLLMGDFDGNGYVANGSSLTYTHVFEPATQAGVEISSIDSVTLEVGIFDDLRCRRLSWCVNDLFNVPEVASIDLNSIDWQTGGATAKVFFGDITAEADLLLNNGILNVVITSEVGDFQVVWSELTTTYTWESSGGVGAAGSSSPMPEPNAALVFAIGALVMQRRVRKALAS